MSLSAALLTLALAADAGTATKPAAADAGAKPAEKKAEAPKPIFQVKEGIATPESVLYDADADVYLVSNINGTPLTKDGNGFISVLSPDGKVENLKFIEGGKNGVKLDAPKGMGISKGVLYVADIDTVRMFDRKTGKPKGEVAIKGASFLNDIAVGPKGDVYVSDSGMKQGEKDFEPTGTDAVYKINGKAAKALAKDKELGRPNGLLANKDGIWVSNFANNEVWQLDEKGSKKGTVTSIPQGGLDGLVEIDGGDVLVSSWQAQTVYRGKIGGTFAPVLEGLSAPADIGYDSKRKRVLVPRFMDNAVEAYELK